MARPGFVARAGDRYSQREGLRWSEYFDIQGTLVPLSGAASIDFCEHTLAELTSENPVQGKFVNSA
jgi:hypothetical protein